MKAAQVNKLYSKLTPQEQAALAFEACARLDEAELDAILDSVPRVTYSGIHADYRQRAAGLQNLTAVYAMSYWKTHALACMAEMLEEHDVANRFLAKLKALEVALVDVCKQFKVDIAAVKTLAKCLPAYDYPDSLTDDELTRQYTELFMKAVEFGK